MSTLALEFLSDYGSNANIAGYVIRYIIATASSLQLNCCNESDTHVVVVMRM